MANTYTLIASSTVGASSVASVSFSSIPSTYTDLLLRVSVRYNGASNWLNLSLNGSSSNLSTRFLYADGSGVASLSGTINALLGNQSGYTANSFSNGDLYITNYAGSTNKSYSIDTVQESNLASPIYAFLIAGLWSNTAAINEITLTPEGSGVNIVQYSSFYLYGIKNS